MRGAPRGITARAQTQPETCETRPGQARPGREWKKGGSRVAASRWQGGRGGEHFPSLRRHAPRAQPAAACCLYLKDLRQALVAALL